MQVNKINNNINFNGYKNIISDDLQASAGRLIYFSAQLNNEGEKDLDNYRRLIDSNTIFYRSSDNDVINCLYISSGDKDRISMNMRPLAWGEELQALSKELVPDVYKKEESAFLKAYTLIASLTRRMMNNNLCMKDRQIVDVFKQTVDTFVKIGSENKTAFDFVENSMLENKPFDKLAFFINRRIQQSMNVLFK